MWSLQIELTKMRSYWSMTVSNMTGVHIKRGKFGNRHTGREPNVNENRDEGDASTSHGT